MNSTDIPGDPSRAVIPDPRRLFGNWQRPKIFSRSDRGQFRRGHVRHQVWDTGHPYAEPVPEERLWAGARASRAAAVNLPWP